MPYETDFYVKSNIIGYTGDLNNNPTVYFKNGNKFGRITQDHGHQDNIGRNKVREYADYDISNVEGRAREYYNGDYQHTSRHAFVPLNGNQNTLNTLAQAINAFPNAKPKYQ
ncbi:hypothetical protein [Shewanella sp. SR44-3]|uniref:hypothetical protein n=1 Tax=unclassified Shewanella TaxID=196818 RepID=UPI0015FDDB71|nr:hypothetical protein [Shewanella sp. SR44-3]MBB1268164.1 hypothetical protein [Shewanella sp. SR44-3]